jgi:hypothetical protein
MVRVPGQLREIGRLDLVGQIEQKRLYEFTVLNSTSRSALSREETPNKSTSYRTDSNSSRLKFGGLGVLLVTMRLS